MPTAPKPITLDLQRDLPKVREQMAEVLTAQKTHRCDYTAPCVVGAMVPKSKRAALENLSLNAAGNTEIGFLIRIGVVSVPNGQSRDFTALQKAFDSGEKSRLDRTLARIEKKYLASVSA